MEQGTFFSPQGGEVSIIHELNYICFKMYLGQRIPEKNRIARKGERKVKERMGKTNEGEKEWGTLLIFLEAHG